MGTSTYKLWNYRQNNWLNWRYLLHFKGNSWVIIDFKLTKAPTGAIGISDRDYC